MAYIFLVAAFALNAIANILLKHASFRGVTLSGSFGELVSANLLLLGGLLAFALNAMLYFLSLRTLPLTVAYPTMVGMSFVIIGLYGAMILGEHFSPLHLLGYGAILFGIGIVLYTTAL